MDIYAECLLRTPKTGDFGGGLLLLTFTPLMGLTPLVLQFLPGGTDGDDDVAGSKFVVTATWDDVPHLAPEEKAELLASIPHYQRDARTKGIPSLGSGAIYPVSQDDVVIDDFPLPSYWPRGFGLDTGWAWTAAVWGAFDRQAQVLYIYDVYKRGRAEPSVHAAAIRSRGEWIPGVADAAAINMSDGRQVVQIYQQLGLKLQLANRSVDAGIQEVWESLSLGRLKVFKSCRAWFDEYLLYRRDDKGRIVKANDHLMDATRYLVRGRRCMTTEPDPVERLTRYVRRDYGPHGWMA